MCDPVVIKVDSSGGMFLVWDVHVVKKGTEVGGEEPARPEGVGECLADCGNELF